MCFMDTAMLLTTRLQKEESREKVTSRVEWFLLTSPKHARKSKSLRISYHTGRTHTRVSTCDSGCWRYRKRKKKRSSNTKEPGKKKRKGKSIRGPQHEKMANWAKIEEVSLRKTSIQDIFESIKKNRLTKPRRCRRFRAEQHSPWHIFFHLE